MIKYKRGVSEPLHLIAGVCLILGGILYIFNNGNWGLVIASIGLLVEAMKQVIK